MKILLTGGTGFFGSNLIEKLLNKSHDIILIKRKDSNLDRISHLSNNIKTIDIDSCDLNKIFHKYEKIDLCVHAATVYSASNDTFKDLIYCNLTFPLNLLRCSIKNNVKCFINTDTFYSSFNNEYSNLNEYTTSKIQFKEWGNLFDIKDQIKFINVRLFHVYGPKDNKSKFVNNIIYQLEQNKNEIKLTEGLQKRDFIFIDDATKAYEMIISKNNVIEDRQIDIGTGKTISIRNFVEKIHNILKSKTTLKFGELPKRDGEIMESYANTSIIKSLGWKQDFSLTDGLNKIIN